MDVPDNFTYRKQNAKTQKQNTQNKDFQQAPTKQVTKLCKINDIVEVPVTKFTSSTLDCCKENPYWAEVSMLWSFGSVLEEPGRKKRNVDKNLQSQF